MKTNSPPILQFLGATGTVTGSKTALFAGTDSKDRVMVDCGLFQGPKALRLRNREPFPVDPHSIGAVLLTHGHLDHCGYLPRLVQDGFRGRVFCTEATASIARIILLDSANLQEEEAKYANKKGFSRHSPALPLYTTDDVLDVIDLLEPIDLDQPIKIGRLLTATFTEAGHILGSTSIKLTCDGYGSILLSGDIGRYGAPILPEPAAHHDVDWVVMESTYGGRLHSNTDVFSALAHVVNESCERGGILLIPAFAVGRTQLLLFALRQLKAEKAIPDLPIYIDSPMAIRVTGMHTRFIRDYDPESRYMNDSGEQPLLPENLHIQRSVDESKALNDIKRDAIIISASGMATGGRILHHLANRLPHKQNTVLFIGYQAVGTRGRTIVSGETRVKIHGQMVPIKANIQSLDGFSAHADQDELIIWLKKFSRLPSRIFLNHGEEDSMEQLRDVLRKQMTCEIVIPDYLDGFELMSGIKAPSL
ncbi:MBL fold metallo-hydrolase [bacterium]|nr:MBL fold metallo-hydrolase [candidate division CSSED10-310 bacterium]